MKQILFILSLLCLSVAAVAKEPEMPSSYNFQRAVEAYQNQDYATAIDFSNKELSESPKNGYAYMLLGGSYYVQDEFGKALDALNTALKLLPQKAQTARGGAYNVRAMVNLALNDTVKALADYQAAANLRVDDAFTSHAELLYDMGRYAEADADYDTMISLNEGDPTPYIGKARNAIAQKQFDHALPLLDRAILLQPDNDNPYGWRAEIYLGLKKYNEATDDIIKGIELRNDKVGSLVASLPSEACPIMTAKLKIQCKKEPQNALWPYVLGLVLSSQKDYAGAIDAYSAANDIEANSTFLNTISDTYKNLLDYDNALLYIDKAIALDPDDDDLLHSKANLLRLMRRYDESIALFEQLVDSHPDHAGTYFNKAMVERLNAKPEKALVDFTTALILEPTAPVSYLYRGRIYSTLGKDELARADYDMVVKLDSVPSSNSVAMYALLSLGREEEAFRFMDAVIECDSIDNGAQYDAACLYSLANHTQQSLQYLAKALELGYSNIPNILADADLQNLRQLPEFQSLLEPYLPQAVAKKHEADSTDGVEHVALVPFTKVGGVTRVKCTINDLPLHFIFDTGAADVTISMVEANFMLKNDYIKPSA